MLLIRNFVSNEGRVAELRSDMFCQQVIVPLKKIKYGVYGDLIIIYPFPYSIYLRGAISEWLLVCRGLLHDSTSRAGSHFRNQGKAHTRLGPLLKQ